MDLTAWLVQTLHTHVNQLTILAHVLLLIGQTAIIVCSTLL